MRKPLIKSILLLPLISVITYIIYSYLLSSLFDFDPTDESLLFKIHFVDPLNFLSSFFIYHLISPTLIIFITVLLFTLQRALTLRNIACIFLIISLTFVATKLLFFFTIPLRLLYLTDFDNNTLFIFLLMNRSMLHTVVFISCLAFFCHYVFTKISKSNNVLNFNSIMTKSIIVCFYSVFIIVTFISYARYSVFSPPFAVVERLDDYLPYVIAIAFFYLYCWVNEYLKKVVHVEHYCVNIIKAYSLSIVLHILFANLLFIFIMFIKSLVNHHDQIILFFKQTYWLWSIILIGTAAIFIIVVARQSTHIAYKIIHYLLFIGLSGFILCVLNLLGSSFETILGVYALVLFLISFTVWINAFIVKLAISQFFYNEKPMNIDTLSNLNQEEYH